MKKSLYVKDQNLSNFISDWVETKNEKQDEIDNNDLRDEKIKKQQKILVEEGNTKK
jgi:hypothetical protein